MKRILQGEEPSSVMSLDVLSDPSVLAPFVKYAHEHGTHHD